MIVPTMYHRFGYLLQKKKKGKRKKMKRTALETAITNIVRTEQSRHLRGIYIHEIINSKGDKKVHV